MLIKPKKQRKQRNPRKLIKVLLVTAAVMVICVTAVTTGVSVSVPVYASGSLFSYNYNFSSGSDSGDVFGRPTSADVFVLPDQMNENTRRNKDAAHYPPPFGVGSGYIPTEQVSLYHNNSPQHSGASGSGSVVIINQPTRSDHHGDVSAGLLPNNTTIQGIDGVSAMQDIRAGSLNGVTAFDYNGMLPPTSINSSDILQTLPLYYEDGSIGTLSIPKLNLTVKVYSGETLENMRIGLGHFEFTSAWDGNVGIAGHNRGVPFAIGGVKDLKNGDEIIFTTRYGVRVYEVFHREKIFDTDYSRLGWSDVNLLTIITCVENAQGMRWCVVAREK